MEESRPGFVVWIARDEGGPSGLSEILGSKGRAHRRVALSILWAAWWGLW